MILCHRHFLNKNIKQRQFCFFSMSNHSFLRFLSLSSQRTSWLQSSQMFLCLVEIRMKVVVVQKSWRDHERNRRILKCPLLLSVVSILKQGEIRESLLFDCIPVAESLPNSFPRCDSNMWRCQGINRRCNGPLDCLF